MHLISIFWACGFGEFELKNLGFSATVKVKQAKIV